MPLFNVEIEGVVVVDAPDADAAMDVVRGKIDGVGHLANELRAIHASPIASEADLREGWTLDSYPFGKACDECVGEILGASK